MTQAMRHVGNQASWTARFRDARARRGAAA